MTFPLAFDVIKPVFDTTNQSLEEASATMGTTRRQTFRYVILSSASPPNAPAASFN